MSTPINDGGPAFPAVINGTTRTDAYGMSLRDYFAANAMLGLLVRPGSINTKQDAEFAYMVADAMLKARTE